MSAPNAARTPDTAGSPVIVDAEYVAAVCRLAAASVPHATRLSARAVVQRADESGVTVVLATPRIRRTVEHALRLHGYQLAGIPPGDPAAGSAVGGAADLAVRVTGWSASGLARRVTVLARAVAGLERALPTTISQAARAYALLHDDLNPTVALYGIADVLRADLTAQVIRRAGPLPNGRPSPHRAPEPVRRHLDTIGDLTQRTTDLLAQHWDAAVRVAGRYAELAHRHPPATAQAKAITDIQETVRRKRETDLFLDACAWADSRLGATRGNADGTARTADVAAFARWYITEFWPPNGSYVPFEEAARRWHVRGRPTGRRRTAGARHQPPTSELASESETPSGGTQ